MNLMDYQSTSATIVKRNESSYLNKIIDTLEQSKSYDTFSFKNFNLLNLEEQLNIITLWLSTAVYPHVQKSTSKDVKHLYDVLTRLGRIANKVKNQAMSRPKKRNYEPIECSICNTRVETNHDASFWNSLNGHQHFEEKVVATINTRNNTVKKDSCIIQIENPEEVQEVKIYPPDIHYNFRFNFNLVPLYTPPMLVPTYIVPTHIRVPPNLVAFHPSMQLPPQMRPIVNQPLRDYCQLVKNLLYPKEVMKQHGIYVLQLRSDRCFCLICTASMESFKNTILEHLQGKKHLKNLESPPIIEGLKQYHSFWVQQSNEVQMEQRHFDAISKDYIQCSPCKKPIHYSEIQEHLTSSAHVLICKKGNGTKTNNNRRYFNNDSNDVTDTDSTTSDSPLRTENNDKALEIHELTKSITENLGFFDQLETRFRTHLEHLKEQPETIVCKCCNKDIPKIISSVKEHILSLNHITLTGISSIKRHFYCGVCKEYTLSTEKRWMVHLNSAFHKEKFDKLDEEIKKNSFEYECSCGTVGFGDKVSIVDHKRSRKKKIEPYKLNHKIKEMIKTDNALKKEIMRLMKDSDSLLELGDKMSQCCEGIENALKELYPDCKAYPFGSRVTGLGNIGSDLDVFLDIGDMYHGNNDQDSTAQRKILKKVRDIFYKKRNIFSEINCIMTARTPIIQVFHRPSEIDCDVSFKNGLSVENTKFLKLCLNLEDSVRPLILFLKNWSKMQNLNSNISTYALSMMVIFYLQTNNHLLSVRTLKFMNKPSKVIQDWEAIIYEKTMEEIKSCVKPNEATLKETLIGLFRFYADFDFKSDVVCPLLGRTIKKADFIQPPNGSSLPKEMETYVRKLSSPTAEIFRATSAMCVQDPFDLSHNLTKACQESLVDKFKTLCDLMAKQMSNAK